MQRNSKTAIYDGLVKPDGVETTALPVRIFHPVFHQFSDRIVDPSFKPDKATIAAVSQLMAANMVIRSSESDAFTTLRPLLTNVLGRTVDQQSSRGSRILDGLVSKRIDECDAPLVCVEYKRSLGEGGCDPAVLAAYSVREFLTLNKVCGFRVF